jgi:hypothetical protein
MRQSAAGREERLDSGQATCDLPASQIASIKFPLKLSAVTQVDSKDSPAVQIADVLIGGTIEATNVLTGLRQGDFDPDAVLKLYRDDQFIYLAPSLDFEEQKKFRKGSQGAEVIEYFSKHFTN